MVNTSVNLCGVSLKNPIIPASGTFGFGHEFADVYDLNCLGGISVKGTTAVERFGNETPRIAEAPSGLLNSVGLQNPGIDTVLGYELPRLRDSYGGAIIANISGFSIDEYVSTCEKADKSKNVDIIEVNISCPNVHNGGMSFGTTASGAAEVTREVKKVCKKPVFMKLSPNVTDIAAIARACEGAGADGISLINTLLAMRIDIRRRRPVLNNVTGGLSGPAIFPVAVRMVWQVYENVGIPIMGLGGVSTADDVIEMMLAGATAVQVGAANLRDPFACKKIADELPALMEKLGVDDINDIIGGAHNG